MYNSTNFQEMLLLQTKYGKRRGMSFSDWVIKKRTISIAALVISAVSQFDFCELETAIYFHSIPDKYNWFIRVYAILMEEAAINADRFASQIDNYLRDTYLTIEKNAWYRDYFDFCVLTMKEVETKRRQGYKSVMSAYVSLLMQQSTYFTCSSLERTIYGIAESGKPLFKKAEHPYIDLGVYDLEKSLLKAGQLSSKKLYDTFNKYGYEIRSLEEWDFLINITRVFDNNTFRMIPYIDERTAFVSIEELFMSNIIEFPRRWKSTEVYSERLKERDYLLPANGVIATYKNAGDIKEIRFIETLHEHEVVMLYRVSTRYGQFSGYYCTKSGRFYSIYDDTVGPMHEQIKNFVLENYMLLTCDYEIRSKRIYAIRQTENLQTEFHYPDQPLVSFQYRTLDRPAVSGKAQWRAHAYHKEEYQEEIKTRVGYIRNLPTGQKASDTACEYAGKLGIRLAEGKTYVRSHLYRVYHKLKKNA